MWVRIDDQIAHHPKFLTAGPVAAWLWVCGLCYCNKYLTDGFILLSSLSALGTIPNVQKHAERLVVVGLWQRVEGGFQVHDYAEYNDTAAVIKKRREEDRFRKESRRNPDGIQTESDGNPNASRARGRGVGSGSESESGSRSEGEPGEPPAGATLVGREHREHASCGRVCVPAFLHRRFRTQVGGAESTADRTLRAFYRRVLAGIPESQVIGDDPVKFWQAYFAAEFPSAAPSKVSASAAAVDRWAERKRAELAQRARSDA